ncbi:o-succinylbenzoate synthase [Tessaracoccus antarcticus]|uniref:o-succinylbenzoate synthase n=1 Tax=Tessaracoccus antarcticus TaxID=2479848 RepID=A0A3M0G2T9_9ACTN|nr:o-succinylbenzoate synthase [Tessaracoccus antarcticus]RMB58457.1 O-succinylbenzoate synthase [Tessaracoccus antarcticus]
MRPHVFDIPLTTRFRGITRRQGILLEGPRGWAEWSPFPEYDDIESASWLCAALEAATTDWPRALRDEVPVNAIVPALPPAAAAARVRASGCSTAKVKVAERGETLEDDIARVAAVREVLGKDGRIRVDANGGWDLQQAATAIAELAPFGLEYAEQPCQDVESLAALRRVLSARGIAVPIAADESIRRAGDPLRVRDAGAADIAILKVQPLGGVRRCLELAEVLGMPVVVSSALETSVGLRAGVALAAALPSLDHACGLETGSLLLDDVTTVPLRARHGRLPVEDFVVDPEALLRTRADDDVALWWLERLRRVAALLPQWPSTKDLT